jgi:hypothetical protein
MRCEFKLIAMRDMYHNVKHSRPVGKWKIEDHRKPQKEGRSNRTKSDSKLYQASSLLRLVRVYAARSLELCWRCIIWYKIIGHGAITFPIQHCGRDKGMPMGRSVNWENMARRKEQDSGKRGVESSLYDCLGV